MLCTLSERLWGTKTTVQDISEYVSPSKSTEASDSPNSKAVSCAALVDNGNHSTDHCSLWMVDGNDAVEVMNEGVIVYAADHFCIKGKEVKHDNGDVLVDHSQRKDVEHKFKYLSITQFRQCNEDIYQWLMCNDNNSIANEYGILFNNINCGCSFSFNIYIGLVNSCAPSTTKDVTRKRGMMFEICCDLKEYERGESTWIDICNGCFLRVYERSKDREAYMIVTTNAEALNIDSSNMLCVLTLSHEDYIYPQVSEQKLTWWGPDVASSHGHRKMFAVLFNKGFLGDDIKYQMQVDSLYAYITNIMRKCPSLTNGHAEDGDDVEYQECDFSMEVDTEDTIQLIEHSISSQDKVNLQCRDTSRDKIIKNPNAKLHKLMYVGKDKTFVVRATMSRDVANINAELEVLQFKEGNDAVVATIGGTKMTYNGKPVCPVKSLLNDNERRMLFVDETNKSHIYCMDIERETIVSRCNNVLPVHNIVETYKGAGCTAEPTFLAHNANQLFTLDVRQNDTASTSSLLPSISYATNVQFTCADADADGHVLMGSKMGDMRLYDGKANKDGKIKRAKTHLLGLGEPLLHVCVNKDGSWILGTCSRYLVLFPVKLNQNKKTGFVTALGKSKPKPLILKLNMHDMSLYNIVDLYFQKAEFNSNETAIVTSTGNLAIIWNFQKVIENNASNIDVNENSYSITSVDDYIKDVGFIKSTHGGDSIVLATPCGVTTASVTKHVH